MHLVHCDRFTNEVDTLARHIDIVYILISYIDTLNYLQNGLRFVLVLYHNVIWNVDF